MKKKIKTKFILAMFAFCHICYFLLSEELPKPTYDNSLIVSFTYTLPVPPSSEIDYIKSQFGSGLYASLAFSSFPDVDMNWHINASDADNNIQSFKNTINSLVAKAKTYGVGIHIIINYGLSRSVNLYQSAKDEDIRNAQWYNDNNLASQTQLGSTSELNVQLDEADIDIEAILLNPENEANTGASSQHQLYEPYSITDISTPMGSTVNQYVFTTFSRYARKLRNHLEAKTRAAFDYLKKKQEENPGIHIIVSTPGEAELNALRQKAPPPLQEFFCDYSPFAVLEFRDWIKHEGMYGSNGKYEGEGYTNGGSRYQGSSGLQHFNQDFGTGFTTWNLKYYNWSLSDPVDSNYQDTFNPDTRIIPFTQYTFNSMMPTSGPNYIAGGFDPPRIMQEKGDDPLWDLMQTFRATMVHHMVKDIATIARESGFNKNQYYTHQIPADYLWGTKPDDPNITPNPRFYSSASPLWTAKAYSDMGIGVTMYDINFVTHYARTSQYILPVISSLGDNWGALEYNPEIIVTGNVNDINTVDAIYQQIMRLYNYNVHVINFFLWQGDIKYQFKGNNRESATKQFFDTVKDKARQSTSTVFTPKEVENFTGQYNQTNGSIDLNWSPKIWTDLNHRWKDWGDFKEFVLYRGYAEDFQANSAAEIARITDYSYKDTGFLNSNTVYYKLAAVNVNGQRGDLVTVSIKTGAGGTASLEVSRTTLNFGACTCGVVTPSQDFLIDNTGSGVMNWSISENASWLTCHSVSGINSGKIKVTVDASGQKPGTYSELITINAAGAIGSPKTINVVLRVYSSGTDAAPFGTFATPVHNSKVQSSIPVTGWVLDDIGVDSVKIYRKDGGKLVFIGDAVMVEGPRPDVEVAYPDYPFNYKAGWGYMMLTNFLPNQGNGTFTIQAIARDNTGHQVTLGSKTITCDNANAVKPFGAIDTPGQGGVASGSKYINWGWALTPQPSTIPFNGSTINVYIDGVNIGNPVYNRYRSDIAGFFPGYNNSNGAAGYFYLDTTAYTNGVHTISWTVRDNGGNVDGIGSRYFTIDNTGGTAKSMGMDASFSMLESDPLPFKINVADISRIPTDHSRPIGVVKGYEDASAMKKIYPDKTGIITIQINELQRLEVHLPGEMPGHSRDRVWQGFQVRGNRLAALPVGSTLDTRNGIFFWQPGLAYVGKYKFVFIRHENSGKLILTNMAINIEPKYEIPRR